MNKTLLTIAALLVASGLILSACASAGAAGSLAGSSWKLLSYGPSQNPTAAATDTPTNVDFGRDGTVSGNVGCNSFSGKFQVQNGAITFSQMISTMMGCQEPQMTQETIALKVMSGTARFELQGSTLVIYAADGVNAITLSK